MVQVVLPLIGPMQSKYSMKTKFDFHLNIAIILFNKTCFFLVITCAQIIHHGNLVKVVHNLTPEWYKNHSEMLLRKAVSLVDCVPVVEVNL